jgi:hypothetical protein
MLTFKFKTVYLATKTVLESKIAITGRSKSGREDTGILTVAMKKK